MVEPLQKSQENTDFAEEPQIVNLIFAPLSISYKNLDFIFWSNTN